MGTGRPERYITLGFEGNAAKLLMIGTIINEDSTLNGKTIIPPTGFTGSVPLGVLRCLGYAEITIGKGSSPSDDVDTK